VSQSGKSEFTEAGVCAHRNWCLNKHGCGHSNILSSLATPLLYLDFTHSGCSALAIAPCAHDLWCHSHSPHYLVSRCTFTPIVSRFTTTTPPVSSTLQHSVTRNTKSHSVTRMQHIPISKIVQARSGRMEIAGTDQARRRQIFCLPAICSQMRPHVTGRHAVHMLLCNY